jgi:hypothetical protein
MMVNTGIIPEILSLMIPIEPKIQETIIETSITTKDNPVNKPIKN